MWEFEHTIETAAAPASLWRLYSDVSTWPSWDKANEWTALDGPFEAGTRGRMKFIGQDALDFRLVEAQPERLFVDETDVPGAVLRFEHRIEPIEAGTRLTHRVVIDGPAAAAMGPQLGPVITAGVPEAIENVAEQAMRAQAAG